jgi:hypothetical protein
VALLFGFLQDVLLYSTAAYEAIDVNVACLADTVGPILWRKDEKCSMKMKNIRLKKTAKANRAEKLNEEEEMDAYRRAYLEGICTRKGERGGEEKKEGKEGM